MQPSEQFQDEYPAPMGDFVDDQKPDRYDSIRLAQPIVDLDSECTGPTGRGG